jgi:hypothetical protein
VTNPINVPETLTIGIESIVCSSMREATRPTEASCEQVSGLGVIASPQVVSAAFLITSRSERMPTSFRSSTTGRWRTPDRCISRAATPTDTVGETTTTLRVMIADVFMTAS